MVEYAHWLEYIAYKRAKAKTNLQAIFMKQPQLFQVKHFFFFFWMAAAIFLTHMLISHTILIILWCKNISSIYCLVFLFCIRPHLGDKLWLYMLVCDNDDDVGIS